MSCSCKSCKSVKRAGVFGTEHADTCAEMRAKGRWHIFICSRHERACLLDPFFPLTPRKKSFLQPGKHVRFKNILEGRIWKNRNSSIDLFRPRFTAFVSLVGNDSLCSAFDVALNVVGCVCIACIISKWMVMFDYAGKQLPRERKKAKARLLF